MGGQGHAAHQAVVVLTRGITAPRPALGGLFQR